MAKSAKHKKLRKKEKSKTQLKGTLSLLKAQNETELNLKTKKILIRKQLANPQEEEASTKRKQTLDDILSSLNHHNVNIKKGALEGLLELATSYDHLLSSNLERIIQKISSITSDTEDVVRKENLKIAGIIFQKISESQLEPFWNTVLNYINCSLNNLSSKVRFGTLSFITLLNIHFPNLISSSIQSLLPSVLELITSKGETNKKGTLKVEIFDRQSDSLKQRIRVINVIAKCLEQRRKKYLIGGAVQKESIEYPQSLDGIYIFPAGYYGEELSSNNKNKGLEVGFWTKFAQNCLPTLFQIWIEIGPSERELNNSTSNPFGEGKKGADPSLHQRSSSNLNEESVNILHSIVDIMVHLIEEDKIENELASKEDRTRLIETLKKTCGKDLTKYFLDWLPFSNSRETQRQEVVSINLKLFYFASYLHLFDPKLTKKFERYTKMVIDRSLLNQEQVKILFKILTFINIQNVESIATKLILSSLDSNLRSVTLEFLLNSLNRGRTRESERIIKSLDWGLISSELLASEDPELTPELISLLSQISIMRLAPLEELLRGNIHLFKEFLKVGNSPEIWSKTIQLFYYSDILDLLNHSSFSHMPRDLKDSLTTLSNYS